MEIRLRKARICKELEAAKAWDIRVEVFDVRAPEEKMTFGGDQTALQATSDNSLSTIS